MTTLALPAELETVERAGINATQLALLAGRSERTAARWLAGETTPRGEAKARLAELSGVIDELARALPKADAARWLGQRNPELDYRSPAELIAEGRARDVLALLGAIGEGVFL